VIALVDKPGQLGNRLLRFAQFIAYAIEHDVTVADLSLGDYASHFPTLSANALCAFPGPRRSVALPLGPRTALYRAGYYAAGAMARTRPTLPGTRLVRLDWHEFYDLDADPLELHRRRLVLAQGWLFRAQLGVESHGEKIRRFLTPHAHVLGTARDAVARARSHCDVLVGLHVRHGDYRDFQGGRYYYALERYASIALDAAALFSPARVGFLVCSDERYAPDQFPGLEVSMGPGDALGDLYALSACDYLVGPPSTFTAWASFYGRVPLCQLSGANQRFELDDFRVTHISPLGGTVDHGAAQVTRRRRT
jgi:hypothetical protein